jgi:hypothetical protein
MFSQGIDEDTASTRREGVRNGDLEEYGAPENREVVSQNDESQFADLSPAASRSNMIPQSAFNLRDDGLNLNSFSVSLKVEADLH